MKLMLFLLLGLLVVLAFFFWASYPWRLSAYQQSEPIHSLASGTAEVSSPPVTLTVLTWNMSFAYGLGSEGTDDYVVKDRGHFEKNLEQIAQTILRSQADVVFLQEVDFNSARTFGVNQLLWLAQATGLSYFAEAPSWRVNYVPHPLRDFSKHFGRVSSGGGILSRWPIKSNQVHYLTKPESKAWWYNLFYLFRYIQVASIQVLDRTLTVANVHFEAFDRDNKRLHAVYLNQLVKDQKIDIIAGDFNMLPDGALKRSSFAGSTDDYENDQTFSEVRKIPHVEVVEQSAYLLQEDKWFTFPSHRPDRRLDYIFYDKQWNLLSAQILEPTRPEASDHLPIMATFKFFDPQFIRD